VDAVIDTRLRNTSQLAGWAKRDDLAFLLRDGFGMAYEHILAFAPTAELLDSYRADSDWPRYEQAYRRLLVERRAEETGRTLFECYRRPCFLCSEPTADFCHRRLLAEYLLGTLHGIIVTHLALAPTTSARLRKELVGL
jgi:hypothetical protein